MFNTSQIVYKNLLQTSDRCWFVNQWSSVKPWLFIYKPYSAWEQMEKEIAHCKIIYWNFYSQETVKIKMAFCISPSKHNTTGLADLSHYGHRQSSVTISTKAVNIKIFVSCLMTEDQLLCMWEFLSFLKSSSNYWNKNQFSPSVLAYN